MITTRYVEVLGGPNQYVCLNNPLTKRRLPKRKMSNGRYVPQYEMVAEDGRTIYVDCHLIDKEVARNTSKTKKKKKLSLLALTGLFH